MATVSFFTPEYIGNPQTFGDKVQNFVENYFDLKNSSCIATALKVISYATLIIPAIMLAIKTYLRYSSGSLEVPILTCCAMPPMPLAPQVPIPAEITAVLDTTPQFRGYLIGEPGTELAGTNLTAATIRPANLLFRALFGDGATTMPGSGQLFAFTQDPEAIRAQIQDLDDEITITTEGNCRIAGRDGEIPLLQLYGDNEFRISRDEIQSILDSQKIYTASIFPREFYLRLKRAMQEDGIVTLPGNDGAPIKVSQLNTPHCRQVVQEAANNPDLRDLLDLTIYQLGSLVVKTEDYILLTNPDGALRERNVGDRDTIRLINACGIRGLYARPEGTIRNRTIMTQAFRTALISAESGHVVFPAVGMGVWGGDPELYWKSFLDAVIEAPEEIEHIFVNPRHQRTPRGRYAGQTGAEFQQFLDEYRRRHAYNPEALANLDKIINLHDRQTDVLHLSHQLKRAFPDKTVSIFNASDPDVTLGNHVGEYVNNLNHPNTTEENYTAIGTNGLCFEKITDVHAHDDRIIQT
ncbi:MAG: hypothetical protein K1X28_07015 [Parachlamydiales bacterium]|nr:hypothetical protein [Parachlamydiales bacterium]